MHVMMTVVCILGVQYSRGWGYIVAQLCLHITSHYACLTEHWLCSLGRYKNKQVRV